MGGCLEAPPGEMRSGDRVSRSFPQKGDVGKRFPIPEAWGSEGARFPEFPPKGGRGETFPHPESMGERGGAFPTLGDASPWNTNQSGRIPISSSIPVKRKNSLDTLVVGYRLDSVVWNSSEYPP